MINKYILSLYFLSIQQKNNFLNPINSKLSKLIQNSNKPFSKTILLIHPSQSRISNLQTPKTLQHAKTIHKTIRINSKHKTSKSHSPIPFSNQPFINSNSISPKQASKFLIYSIKSFY